MLDPQWGQAPITLTAGETRELPTIIVNPAGRSLQVFVGDAAGKPVKDAQLFVAGARTPQLTDDKGQVTLTKLPLRGKITLIAAHPTEEWFATELVEPTGDYWPGLLLKPLGKATGLLISKPGGKPMDGYQVYVSLGGNDFWRLDQSLRPRLNLMASRRDLTTDADGRWACRRPAPGRSIRGRGATEGTGPRLGWPPDRPVHRRGRGNRTGRRSV